MSYINFTPGGVYGTKKAGRIG